MKLSIWLSGLAVRDALLSHLVLAAVAVAIVVPLLVAILVPGGVALVRTTLGAIVRGLVSTPLGRGVLACLVVGLVAWEARAALDSSIELRRQLAAQRSAAAEALAAEKARSAAAAALAAQARADAENQHAVAVAAADRGRAAAAERDDLAEQVADYRDRLASAPASRTCRHRFILTPAQAADLARIGAPR